MSRLVADSRLDRLNIILDTFDFLIHTCTPLILYLSLYTLFHYDLLSVELDRVLDCRNDSQLVGLDLWLDLVDVLELKLVIVAIQKPFQDQTEVRNDFDLLFHRGLQLVV